MSTLQLFPSVSHSVATGLSDCYTITVRVVKSPLFYLVMATESKSSDASKLGYAKEELGSASFK